MHGPRDNPTWQMKAKMKKERREERDLKYNSSFRSSSLPTDPQNDNGYRY
jgi:hypothetical protein